MSTKKVVKGYAEVHTLLHTVRCIQQHEAQLCTLMQAIKNEGKISAGVRKELLALLGDMPGAEYGVEVESLREVLG